MNNLEQAMKIIRKKKLKNNREPYTFDDYIENVVKKSLDGVFMED